MAYEDFELDLRVWLGLVWVPRLAQEYIELYLPTYVHFVWKTRTSLVLEERIGEPSLRVWFGLV